MIRAQELGAGSVQLVRRPRLRRGKQCERCVRSAGIVLGLRGREGALGTARRVGCQPRCPFEEGCGGRESPTGLRPVGRPLELGGDRFIGPHSSMRAMPRPAVGIELRIGDLGQDAVHFLPFLERGRPVCG